MFSDVRLRRLGPTTDVPRTSADLGLTRPGEIQPSRPSCSERAPMQLLDRAFVIEALLREVRCSNGLLSTVPLPQTVCPEVASAPSKNN